LGLTTVTQDAGTADTTVAAALTQNATVAVNLSAVADTPGLAGDAESQVQLFSSQARTSLLTEAVINDGRVDTGANLNLAIRLAAVQLSDPQEILTTVLTGSAIGSGVKLQFTNAALPVELDATQVGGQWQISVESKYISSPIDAILVIPKGNGYGARDVTVTAKTVDGTSINTSVVDTDTFTILSTIPPQPVVGVLPEVRGSDINAASTQGLKLTDLVRVPLLNESVVLELIGLTAGVQVKVGNTVLNPVSLMTVDGASLTAVRLTATQLDTARLVLPADVANGTTALSFSTRSGSSDGYVVDPKTSLPTSEVRYVYSRLVDFDVNLGVVTSGNDHLVVLSQSVNAGAGDDTVVVDGQGNGALAGGAGTDTLSLAGLQGSIVDLNFGKMIALSADSALQSTSSAVRAVSGFEVLVGSAANDALVSNGDSTIAMTLRGRGGDDILVGGAGNDLIEGGVGVDELVGGAGSDSFVLTKGSGQDTVSDFKANSDKIILAGFGLSFGVKQSLPTAVQLTQPNAGDWLLTVTDASSSGNAGAQLLLKGTALLSKADIISSLSFDDTKDWAGGDVYASDFQMPVDTQALAISSLARETYFGDKYEFSDLDSLLSVIADARFERALEVNMITHLGKVNSLDMKDYKGFAGTQNDDILAGNDQGAVLFGGSGGSDVLIGGGASDILVAGAKTLLDESRVSDDLTGGGGADMFVFMKSNQSYVEPDPLNVDSTLKNIYEVNVLDFNRAEGDRIIAVGYGDDVNAIKIDNIDAASNSQAVHFSDSLTVYFDLSFAREFDSNFSLRMADFDKV
jgi:Ca2+-binding RTX toxin-like protein